MADLAICQYYEYAVALRQAQLLIFRKRSTESAKNGRLRAEFCLAREAHAIRSKGERNFWAIMSYCCWFSAGKRVIGDFDGCDFDGPPDTRQLEINGLCLPLDLCGAGCAFREKLKITGNSDCH